MLALNMYHSVNIGMVDVLVIDIIAVLFFVLSWKGYSYYAERNYGSRSNLMGIMDQMRRRWMRQILNRHTRIADAGLVGNLLRSISFFANTSIFILIGMVTVLGYRESAVEMINALPFAVRTEPFMWEIKVFLLMTIFVYTFFKFTWSLRQYNYCCIMVGAAPMPDENPECHDEYAEIAGNMIANAGKHFNMGMRGYYFGLAAISWFFHPLLFMALTALVVHITYRREFRSAALSSLSGLNERY